MIVSLTETVSWIAHCYEHDATHEHVSLYLLEAPEGTVLIDSGSFYHREEISEDVRNATNGTGPDAIVLSHSDYPHSGNLRSLGADAESIELVASSGSPAQQGLPDARKCSIGDSLQVKGRTLHFIDPPLADRSHTTWIYEDHDGVLFTADGFGNYHDPGQCGHLADTFSEGTPVEHIRSYHEDNLVWLRYVDPEKVEAALDGIFDRYTINAIAPIHGNPIPSGEIDRYRERLSNVIRDIATSYTVA